MQTSLGLHYSKVQNQPSVLLLALHYSKVQIDGTGSTRMKFLVDSLITSTQRQIQFACSKITTLVIDDFDPLIYTLD
jgi:hypothetical protein